MKNIIIAVITLLCAPAIAQTESKPVWKDVVGTWTGYYMENGQQKSMTLVFEDNEGACTIDMPDHGVKAATCKVMICEAQDFHITKSSLGTPFTFVGKPYGTTMKGKYKVGNSCGPGEQMEFKVERLSSTLRGS